MTKPVNYFDCDEDGIVVATGSVPESQLNLQPLVAGCVRYLGTARPGKQRMVNHQLVDYERPKAYDERRREQYPLVGDQLDAIWKYLAAQQPKNLPDDTASMLEQILSVKDANPKEVENV